MRKLLLGTTALAAAATLSTNAVLADVSISGAHEWSYNSRSSNQTALDGTTFGQDSSVTITFSNKTDSGLSLSYHTAIDTDGGNLGNAENALSISGGFGKIVLGNDDSAADAYIIDEMDLIAEEASPSQVSATIGTSSSLSLPAGADNNKISYHLPAMGGLTAGLSFEDAGEEATSADTTTYGAKYSMTAGGASITLGYTTRNTENSTQDIDSDNMGLKVVSGDVSLIVSQGTTESNGEDVHNQGASISYKMPNGMVLGAYTFKSEDDIDTTEEYSKSGAEVQYTIASGLTAVINVDDYDYKSGGASTTADSGTNTKLTLKASF